MIGLPFSSWSTIDGRRLPERAFCRQSITSLLALPVASSITSRNEVPSIRSWNTMRARGLGDHRQGVRIPLGQHLPLLDLRVGIGPQPRAVGQLLAQLLAADLVVDHDLGVAAEDDLRGPSCRGPGAG